MYIPEFVCGMVAGVAVSLIAIVVLALWYERKRK